LLGRNAARSRHRSRTRAAPAAAHRRANGAAASARPTTATWPCPAPRGQTGPALASPRAGPGAAADDQVGPEALGREHLGDAQGGYAANAAATQQQGRGQVRRIWKPQAMSRSVRLRPHSALMHPVPREVSNSS
jgi:hypothetical protein